MLLEVYSGHGSAESYRDLPGASPETPEEALFCPEPTQDYLACCWQAGEIIRDRCERESSEDGDERAAEAREIYLAAGSAAHLTVPGADVEDWLDCDQCRDCFNPAFSYRSGGAAQAALALRRRAKDGSEQAYRFGLIGASDTHDARGGNGFKEFARLEKTEALSRSSLVSGMFGSDSEPFARARPVDVDKVCLAARRDIERGSSFLMTGGLTAVHAASRDRKSIGSALEAREVYATSGDRILLWFDLLNSPDGVAPMGSLVRGQSENPRFRVSAAGAFSQKPGCPDFVRQSMTPERLESLCLGECCNPSDERRAIRRIEIVRIRPQTEAREAIGSRIEDPWKVFECDDRGQGCRVDFEDPEFGSLAQQPAGEVVYYVRVIQEPTLAVNAGGLRCEYDAEGRCIDLDPCYGDDRTDATDDCLAENEEHAWSSPIWIQPTD